MAIFSFSLLVSNGTPITPSVLACKWQEQYGGVEWEPFVRKYMYFKYTIFALVEALVQYYEQSIFFRCLSLILTYVRR